MPRVGIAADHGGFALKAELTASLRAAGYEIEDYGACELDSADDYPDFIIPLARAPEHSEHVPLLESWMRSYKPEELFDKNGRLIPELAELAPKGDRRMGANPPVRLNPELMTLDSQPLIDIAGSLIVAGKGLLATDESDSSDQRFGSLGIPQTMAARREYRETTL